MQQELTKKSDIVSTKDECKNPIFESKEEMQKSLSRLCYGNLHVIGSLWVEGMKSVLVGSKMCLVPTVEAAAKKDETPKKPPKMKYKDLPLYECPHWEYKQYLEDEQYKCLGNNPKILQSYALPTVAAWRKSTIKNFSDFHAFLMECICEVKEMIKEQKNCFVHCMRQEKNLNLRRAVVAIGTAAGYILSARRTPLLYQRLFWTSVGAVSTGTLCFPSETDENVRKVGYEVHKVLKQMLDVWHGAPLLPVQPPLCEKDLPPCPKKGEKKKVDPKHECPKKKK